MHCNGARNDEDHVRQRMLHFSCVCIDDDQDKHEGSPMVTDQGSEGSVPGSPAGEGAFSSLGRDKARAVARTIAQVNIYFIYHIICNISYIYHLLDEIKQGLLQELLLK